MHAKVAINEKVFWWLFIPTILVYITYMILDVMQVDAAQYALMSFQMAESGEYLELTCRNNTMYLDKPPLLFWLSSLSFSVFGVSNFTFKLPSVLASLLAVYSLYKIAGFYYKKHTAIAAALILLTCEAVFFTTSDIRTDNMLLGFSTFAIWQLVAYLHKPSVKYAIFAGVGIAFAMMGKGPLGLIFPMLSIVPQIIYTRNWKAILTYKWLVALPVVGLLLVPMCIGLYSQHGTHGLYFFFWEQSFGRITGENVWKNDMDPFFLVHTFFWAFLPWTFFYIWAFVRQTKNTITSKFSVNNSYPEVLGWSGYLLATLALSQSAYQLPHYIFIATPMAALMTAGMLEQVNWDKVKNYIATQHIVNIFLIVFTTFVGLFLWNHDLIDFVFAGVLLAAFAFVYFKLRKGSLVVLTALVAIVANLTMSTWFFEPLLQLQSSAQVGRYIKTNNLQKEVAVYGQGVWGYAMDFYSESVVKVSTDKKEIGKWYAQNDGLYVFTRDVFVQDLEVDYNVEKIKTFIHRGPNHLTLPFLNPSTRDEHLKTFVLLKLEAK